jgi:hypothetical protein
MTVYGAIYAWSASQIAEIGLQSLTTKSLRWPTRRTGTPAFSGSYEFNLRRDYASKNQREKIQKDFKGFRHGLKARYAGGYGICKNPNEICGVDGT